jgi:hypothetical protein
MELFVFYHTIPHKSRGFFLSPLRISTLSGKAHRPVAVKEG